MSLFVKKHRSKAAKIAGIALFTLLMFVNLQITTNPNNNGDIDLFGLKVTLFTPSTYATGGGSGGSSTCKGTWVFYESHQMCRCEPVQLGQVYECTGCWSWSTSC